METAAARFLIYFNFNEPKEPEKEHVKIHVPEEPGQSSSNAIITSRAKQIHGGQQMRRN